MFSRFNSINTNILEVNAKVKLVYAQFMSNIDLIQINYIIYILL